MGAARVCSRSGCAAWASGLGCSTLTLMPGPASSPTLTQGTNKQRAERHGHAGARPGLLHTDAEGEPPIAPSATISPCLLPSLTRPFQHPGWRVRPCEGAARARRVLRCARCSVLQRGGHLCQHQQGEEPAQPASAQCGQRRRQGLRAAPNPNPNSNPNPDPNPNANPNSNPEP